MYAGGKTKSDALGPILQKSARRLGTGFLDAGEYIRSSEVDGIHFDVDQHRILGEVIAQRIAEVLR